MVYGMPAYNAVQLKLAGQKGQRRKGMPHSHILIKIVNFDIYILIFILYPIAYTFKKTAAPTLSKLKAESSIACTKKYWNVKSKKLNN